MPHSGFVGSLIHITWTRAFGPGDWKTERLTPLYQVIYSLQDRVHCLSSEVPQQRNADGIKYYLSLDLCVAPHIKISSHTSSEVGQLSALAAGLWPKAKRVNRARFIRTSTHRPDALYSTPHLPAADTRVQPIISHWISNSFFFRIKLRKSQTGL